MKKRVATMIALALMAAAPAHAGSSFSFNVITPGSVFYEPAPVFFAPPPMPYFAPQSFYYRSAPIYASPYHAYAPPIYYDDYRAHHHQRRMQREWAEERGYRGWR